MEHIQKYRRTGAGLLQRIRITDSKGQEKRTRKTGLKSTRKPVECRPFRSGYPDPYGNNRSRFSCTFVSGPAGQIRFFRIRIIGSETVGFDIMVMSDSVIRFRCKLSDSVSRVRSSGRIWLPGYLRFSSSVTQIYKWVNYIWAFSGICDIPMINRGFVQSKTVAAQAWMANFFEDTSEKAPNSGQWYLPCFLNRRDAFRLYTQSYQQAYIRKSCFYSLWTKHFRHVSIPKVLFF